MFISIIKVSYKNTIQVYLIILWLHFYDCEDNIDVLSLSNNMMSLIDKGVPADVGEIPYQVAIKRKHPDDMARYHTFCGGTIIGAAKILTAAHCFVSIDITFLFFKKYHVSPLSDTYAVAATLRNLAYNKSVEHEQWRKLLNMTYPDNYFFPYNNIAILFVAKPFEFNQYVAPIEYAEKYADFTGYCLLSGYGQISYNIKSDSLLKTYLELIPRKRCSLNHGRDMTNFICTSKMTADIGLDDSGAPMVYSNTGDPVERSGRVLVGIASGSAYHNLDSFFTRVSSYRRFIESNKCHTLRFQLLFFICMYMIQNIIQF